MTQRSVEIEAADGMCPAALSVPVGGGPWPAVVMFADAGGMRDTMRQMGERLSDLGYIVLVPDFYYRNGPYDPVDMRTAFSTKETAEKIMGMMRGYTADLVVRDAGAFVDYLDSLPEKKPGGVGTTGYCMGGRLSLITAANLGGRIAAAASFHGGNLANADDPDSPHHKASAIKAAVYVAGAIEDQSFPDEQKALLEKSLSDAGVIHTIETYQAHHGFAVADNPSYDPDAAERHWKAMERFSDPFSGKHPEGAYGFPDMSLGLKPLATTPRTAVVRAYLTAKRLTEHGEVGVPYIGHRHDFQIGGP